MKKIIAVLLIFSILFAFTGCSFKKTDNTNNNAIEIISPETSTENPTDTITKASGLNITKPFEFSNGFAWINHQKPEGGTTYSLINTKGDILYSNENIISAHDMSGDTCFIEEKDGENTVYKIIDNSGKEVASSQNGNFDIILSQCDNAFFVYKHISDIDTSKHLFGTIDNKGNFINELKETPLYNTSNTFKSNYLGADFFVVWLSMSDGLLYNANTQNFFYIDNIEYVDKPINIGSNLYFRFDYYSPGITYENTPDKWSKLSNYFSLSSNGTVKEIEKFGNVINEKLLTKLDNKLTVFDPISNESKTFSKYHVLSAKSADKDSFLLQVWGKDKKSYFLLIDASCNITLDPVQADFAEANDGKIILEKDNTFFILDYYGNKLFETSEYSQIKPFNNGIACAYKSIDGTTYYYGLDASGNVVIS